MKIQQTSNQPSFGLKLNINSHTAYCNGRKMISKEEERILKALAEPIGQVGDSLNLQIGSIMRNKISTNNDFRETYTLMGNAIIKGEAKKVNLTQSWKHSEGTIETHKPFEVIKNYFGALVNNPRGHKKIGK